VYSWQAQAIHFGLAREAIVTAGWPVYVERMQLLSITLPTLAENLALDEALLLNAEAGGPEALRLWEWRDSAVVLGAGGRLSDDVDEDACRADGVPILRRSSGGGTVLLGTGCLLFSLVLRFERHPALADLHGSYRHILGLIQQGLESASPSIHIELQGTSDLAIAGRKFSGNAQQRKRTHFLHHGTLLYGFDLELPARYLKAPARQPAYRQGRSHADFMTNVPIARATITQALEEVWQASETLADWPAELTAKLAEEKYKTDVWIRRR